MKELVKSAKIKVSSCEKVMTDTDKYGNNEGGTIPIILDEINKSGKLISGKKNLFAAVGSGWMYCAAIIKWS